MLFWIMDKILALFEWMFGGKTFVLPGDKDYSSKG